VDIQKLKVFGNRLLKFSSTMYKLSGRSQGPFINTLEGREKLNVPGIEDMRIRKGDLWSPYYADSATAYMPFLKYNPDDDTMIVPLGKKKPGRVSEKEIRESLVKRNKSIRTMDHYVYPLERLLVTFPVHNDQTYVFIPCKKLYNLIVSSEGRLGFDFTYDKSGGSEYVLPYTHLFKVGYIHYVMMPEKYSGNARLYTTAGNRNKSKELMPDPQHYDREDIDPMRTVDPLKSYEVKNFKAFLQESYLSGNISRLMKAFYVAVESEKSK